MTYFDNGATTKVYDECLPIINEYLTKQYFNPSALYKNAIDVTKDVNTARDNILRKLNGINGELYFTASGTEADNMAMFSTKKKNNSRIIVSNAEHSAIYQCAKKLEQLGYDVKYAPVDLNGRVILKEFEKLLNDKVSVVSVMHISNETGCINDIKEIARLTKKYSKRAIVHSDGVQAFGKILVNVEDLGVDLYTISAHKIHGPKGIGALYVKKGIHLNPIIFGGGQEKGVRSATENVPYIMAFDFASSKVLEDFSKKFSRKMGFIEYIKEYVTKNISDTLILTPNENCSSHIITLAFKDVRGEVLMHSLEDLGFITGIGSACSSKKGGGRINSALNIPSDYALGVLRISFSEFNTLDEVKNLCENLNKKVEELRQFIRI